MTREGEAAAGASSKGADTVLFTPKEFDVLSKKQKIAEIRNRKQKQETKKKKESTK